MSDRTMYLEALTEQLQTLGPDALAMLAQTEQVDAALLVSLVQAAALALQPGVHDAIDAAAVELARTLVAAARRDAGGVMAAAFDALDLDELRIDVDPEDEPEVLHARLHRIFELGFLVDVLTGARRDKLVDALGLVAGEVMTRDDLEALYEPAFFLSGIAELAEDHPVAELLDAVLAATDWVTNLEAAPDAASVAAIVTAARARYEAELSPVARLVRWGRGVWGALADALLVPERVFAASARALPVWPAPRVVLGQKDGVEVALVVDGDHVNVEVDGGVDFEVEGAFEDGSLVVRVGDWRVDMSAAELVAADYPWKVQLATVAARAPGAVRAELVRQAAATKSLSLRRELERQAAAIVVPELPDDVGQVSFVVLPEGGSPGFLARVTSAGLAGGVPVDGGAVGRWLGSLVGAPEVVVDLRVQAPGVLVEGESWQLAAALAVISERLGAPRQIVASGALGAGVGEVVPVARLEEKQAVVALEVPDRAPPFAGRAPDLAPPFAGRAPDLAPPFAGRAPDLAPPFAGRAPDLAPPFAGRAPEAEVVWVEAPADVRPELARIFGDDWEVRLRAALGVAGDDYARAALRSWRAFWGRRNAMDVAPQVALALRAAQAALAAGVSGVHAIEARWVEAACLLHRGESALADAALGAVAQAIAGTEARLLPALLAEELAAYRGIALVDDGRPAEAAELLRPLLVALDRRAGGGSGGDAVGRRFFEVRVQVAGTLQRAAGFAGDLDEARWLLLESLGLGLPEERARTLADLAEVERRRGDVAAARAALAEARAALDDIESASMAAFTERFLRVYEARAGVAPSTHEIAGPRWEAWPQPIEVLEALLAGPTAALVAWVDEHVREVALIHRLTVLGGLCRAALAGREVQAQVTRLASGCNAPELEALLAGVARGEVTAIAEWAGRCPY